LVQGDVGAASKVRELNKRGEPLIITVITQYEIWRGSGKLSEKEHYILNGLIDKSMIISLEPESAKIAGVINYKLRKKGVYAGSRDCMIAGICIAGNDILLTRKNLVWVS